MMKNWFFFSNKWQLFSETIFPPVFGHRLQAKVAKNGERVIMDIEVSGTPEPKVTWFKDDKPLIEANLSAHKITSSGNCHTLIIEKGIFTFRSVKSIAICEF